MVSLPVTLEMLKSFVVPRIAFPGSIDLKVPGRDGFEIPVRVYIPKTKPDKLIPLLVYIHGGGWIRGTLDQYVLRCGDWFGYLLNLSILFQLMIVWILSDGY